MRATNLYVHLTPDDLAPDTHRCGRPIEKLGAATTDLLTDWLTRYAAAGGKVIVRPVLDLDRSTAVDQHDPPGRCANSCILRDAHCVFPGCRRDSRACDLDHITAYIPIDDGGPPGQTNPRNLAPLCRTHHRIKTFTAWDYKRLDDGTYIWTAPPDTSTKSPRPHAAHHHEEPDAPPPRPTPAGAIGTPSSPTPVVSTTLARRSLLNHRPDLRRT